MKILYVTNAFPLPHLPGAPRYYQTAKWLLRHGHDVTVLCNSRHNYTDDVVIKGTVEQPEMIDGIRIIGISTPSGRRKSKLRRIVNYLTLSVKVYLAGRKLPRQDIVIAGTPPLLTPAAALLLARRSKATSILEIRDLYPQEAKAMGLIKSALLLKLWSAWEVGLRQRFDKIVAVVPLIKPMIEEEGIDPGKITVITNGYDLDTDETVPLGDQLGEFFEENKDRFIVGYLGAMGLAWDIPCMVQAASILKDRDDIAFLMIGKGEYHDPCKQFANDKGLDRVSFFPAVGRKEANTAMRRCDGLMLTYLDNPLHHYSLPNKFFDYMGAGKPIICGGHGETANIIEDASCGLIAKAGDAQGVADAIAQLANDHPEAVEMGKRARQYTEDRLMRDVIFERWKDLLPATGQGSASS